MWGRKSPIEEYLDKYPDSSLREYNEYVKEEERKRHQEKVDSDNRHKALLKSYIGKCFKIDFNGEEIIAIDKKLGIVVTKENNEVNYYWVKDPNSKPSLYRRGTYNSLVL